MALLLALAVLAGCGGDDDAAPRTPTVVSDADPGVIHVHGLGRNPADDSLMIATHTGLFRVGPGSEQPVRVAGNYQDTMGFTVIGPDHFLGSGHPGSIPDDPPFLGLIESRDAGDKWRPISLRGNVDFHVLEAQGRVVYGFGSDFETRDERFLRSDDGGRSWKRLEPPEPLAGLAIDPDDADRIVALGGRRGYLSRDGGGTWRPLSVLGGLVTWTRELGVVAVDAAGTVRRAQDPADDWQEVGRLPGPPAALDAAGDELLAATHDAQVVTSSDRGESWRDAFGG
jgi:hypothetical protein